MKMLFKVIPLILICGCVQSSGNNHRQAIPLIPIEGAIIDSSGKGLPGCLVQLSRLDGKIAKQTTSDIQGIFRLDARPGNYKLIVYFGTISKIEEVKISHEKGRVIKIVRFHKSSYRTVINGFKVIFPSILSSVLSVCCAILIWQYKNYRKRKKSTKIFIDCIYTDLKAMTENLDNVIDSAYESPLESASNPSLTIQKIIENLDKVSKFISVWEDLFGATFVETVPELIASFQRIKSAIENIKIIISVPSISTWLRARRGEMDDARNLLKRRVDECYNILTPHA
jgi:hypothetical protein